MITPAVQSALAIRSPVDGQPSELRSDPSANPNGPPPLAAQMEEDEGAPFQDEQPTEFYVSPRLSFDAEANVVVVSFLDPATGDVQRQYPSEMQVEAYRRQQSAEGESRVQSDHQDGIAEAASVLNRTAARPVEGASANAPTPPAEAEAVEKPSLASGPRIAIVA
ncbi:MAG TPA: hypothetical protein VEY95_14595 [Azospirillaceae bacterium]|nr:hypothetical protein [Azospirillaceae bacterium]